MLTDELKSVYPTSIPTPLCKHCGKPDHGTVACTCLISPIIKDWNTPEEDERPLTEDQKRMLCGLIGEFRHEKYSTRGKCLKCGVAKFQCGRRTFDNWTDLGAVKEALIKRVGGSLWLWDDFTQYAFNQWASEIGELPTIIQCRREFSNWLFDPTRFFDLVCKWMKERNVKNES